MGSGPGSGMAVTVTFAPLFRHVFQELHHMIAFLVLVAEQEIGDTVVSFVACPRGIGKIDLGRCCASFVICWFSTLVNVRG